jgi:hypothetical protein
MVKRDFAGKNNDVSDEYAVTIFRITHKCQKPRDKDWVNCILLVYDASFITVGNGKLL